MKNSYLHFTNEKTGVKIIVPKESGSTSHGMKPPYYVAAVTLKLYTGYM